MKYGEIIEADRIDRQVREEYRKALIEGTRSTVNIYSEKCDTCVFSTNCTVGYGYRYGWRIEVYDWSTKKCVECKWVYAHREEVALDAYIRIHGSKADGYNICGDKYFVIISSMHGCDAVGMDVEQYDGGRVYSRFNFWRLGIK